MWLWRQTPEPPHTLHWCALALLSDVSCTGPSQLLYYHKMIILQNNKTSSSKCTCSFHGYARTSAIRYRPFAFPLFTHRLRRWLKSFSSQVAAACLASQFYRLWQHTWCQVGVYCGFCRRINKHKSNQTLLVRQAAPPLMHWLSPTRTVTQTARTQVMSWFSF